MATTYQVTMQLNAETLEKLTASANVLYGLLATQTSDAAALPLVWLKQPAYSMATMLTWSDAVYQVYTSSSKLATTAPPLFAGFSTPLELGQLLYVGANGTGQAMNNGFPGKLSACNTTATPYVTGVMLAAGEEQATPTCGLPLNGGEGVVMVPQAKLLLFFSPAQVETGQAVRRWPDTAYEAILIDLTGEAERAVAFDINAGWSWEEGVWAQKVPFNTDLGPVLITPNLITTNSDWAARALLREKL